MLRCPFCHLPLADQPPPRCPRCARSLIGVTPIANAQLAHDNRVRDRRANRLVFIIACGVIAMVPCAAFFGYTAAYRWPVGVVLGLVSGAIIWSHARSITFATLVFAVPQMMAPGMGYLMGVPINPLAWLGYLAFGSAIGWWRQALREVQ